ncbi:MAG: alanine/glycine:cation symporter family protein [Saccharofermentanales bacterium]|jgi:AGCS family alanine or glycine:cation symporter|nr:sodium:alanine symporter family protein [Bacillota bacterium]NLB08209.1 alanine:cation symporter family protein [Clostridiales bacterium]
MSEINSIVKIISDFIWNNILLFALLGVGIFLSIKLRFPQLTRLFPSIAKLVRDIRNKVTVKEGAMTPFQSLATAVAAQVGTGNIVGVATAIAAGGPGAAFWMLISAFFGMSTIFSEAVLAQVYREEEDGELVGGPAYYIRNGLKSNWLAIIFAVLCIISLGIVGIMVQSNSIVTSLSDAVGLSKPFITVGLAALVGVILTGGMGRIASFSEKVVPVMAFAYILGSLIIILLNLNILLPSLKMIIVGAFTPQAIGGGVLGITIREASRYGLARGLFSNEAGMGSTPHSHAVAINDHPAEQGFIAMIGVFISTFIICMSTAMVNMLSGSYNANIPAGEMAKDAVLMTQNGFASSFGNFGAIFLSVSLSSFALTTIVGWYFFAESNVKFLGGNHRGLITGFKIVAIAFLIAGPWLDADTIWNLADLFMGAMALPNIIALFVLSGLTKKLLQHYDHYKKTGEVLPLPTLDSGSRKPKSKK